jgi:hypothetical protein
MKNVVRWSAVLIGLALTAVPTYAGNPPIFQNSVKYRDAGAKPAAGRSGSAAIQARALRGQTETIIEVTTGQFDSGVAPVGKLDKVQVKLLADNGDVIVTDNYRKGALSGSYGSFVYDWPARGQKMQVQANVSGIDPTRTDVVTVQGAVALRPDLTVSSIQAVSQAFVGASVTIDALVRETNGDTGARANCVLKVDGVVADHADGIWVDAGDAVTCEFRQTFTTLGTKQLSVELTNVVPGDYDSSNNSKTASIDIVNPTVPVAVWYSYSAGDTTYDAITNTQDHQQFDAFDPAWQSWVVDNDNNVRVHQHDLYYQADLNAAMALTFPVTMQSSVTVDGAEVLVTPSFTVEANSSYSSDWYSSTCGEAYESTRWFRVCKYHYDFGGGSTYDYTNMSTSVRGGSVTFDGWNVSTTRYPDTGDVYVYEYNYGPFTQDYNDPLYPLPDSLGNNLVIRATATDATDRRFEVEAAVQLYEFPTNTQSWDNPCTSYEYTYDYGRYSGHACSHTDAINAGKTGSAFGFGMQ